jgi:hypothetical protein
VIDPGGNVDRQTVDEEARRRRLPLDEGAMGGPDVHRRRGRQSRQAERLEDRLARLVLAFAIHGAFAFQFGGSLLALRRAERSRRFKNKMG